MNEEQLEGQWEQIKGKIQKNWGKLTDDDLNVIKGKKKELIGKLVEHYGIAREQAENDLKKFLDDDE